MFVPNMAFAASDEHAALAAYREFLTTPQTVYLEIFDEVIPWEFEPSDILHAELIDFNNDGTPELFIMLENRFAGGGILIPHIVVQYTGQIEVLFGKLAWIAIDGGNESGSIGLFSLATAVDGQTYIVKVAYEYELDNDVTSYEIKFFALANGAFVLANEAPEIREVRELNFRSRRDVIILLHEIDRILDPSIAPITFARPNTVGVNVNPDDTTFGVPAPFAYNINGHNFFGLRDVAFLLNGTTNQFEVNWDAENNAILITTGIPYTPVGLEVTGRGSSRTQEAVPTNSTIFIDGEEVSLTAYHIRGNNYFMLRELGALLGFDVDWNAETQTILINTN